MTGPGSVGGDRDPSDRQPLMFESGRKIRIGTHAGLPVEVLLTWINCLPLLRGQG
jgi:hypothetical protein